MTKKQKQKLFRFLKEVGAYNAYRVAFMDKIKKIDVSIDEKINRILGGEPINYSFCWEDTKQGHEFWSYLNSFYTLKVAGNIKNIPSITQLIDKNYLNKICKQ